MGFATSPALSLIHTAPTSYYHTGKAAADRRQTLELFIRLLQSERYADVAPRIRASGLVGGLGAISLRVVLGRREFWPVHKCRLRPTCDPSHRRGTRPKILPGPAARLAVRIFYGRR